MKINTTKNMFSVCLCQLCLACVASAAPLDSLEKSFVHPPPSARPWVYWLPLSGNLTQAGITADLEAMARVGTGGVLTAAAMMAANWDGCPETPAPGFPDDGSWVVKWNGLKKLP